VEEFRVAGSLKSVLLSIFLSKEEAVVHVLEGTLDLEEHGEHTWVLGLISDNKYVLIIIFIKVY
jgi:hypothetical protein